MLAAAARTAHARRAALLALTAALPWIGGVGLGLAAASRIAAHWWPPAASAAATLSVVGCALVACLVAAVRGWLAHRPDDLASACMVDERLRLASRLSSALAFEDSEDPFARAAVQDGIRCAAQPGMAKRVRSAFPVLWTPGGTWGAAALVAAVAVIGLVPAWHHADADPVVDPALLAELQADANAKAEAVVERVEANKDLAEAMGDLGESTRDGLRGTPSTPDEVRRAAARRMVDLQERLDKVLSGAEAAKLAALERALASLPLPQEGAARDLAEALKRGDMASAAEQMKALERQLASGELDPSRSEQLKRDLEALAKALENAAESRQALRDALADAGMDPDLASNPEALQRAMDAMKGLSPSQRQALQQAMAAQRSASEAAKAIAGQCKKCAGGQRGQPGDGEQGMAGSGGEQALDEFARFDEMVAAAQEAKSQCASAAESALSGPSGTPGGQGGMGPNRGTGAGGEAEKASTATGTRTKREHVDNRGGDVIARQLVKNPDPESGEATVALKDVARAVERGADTGTPEDPVPPHLREAHRRYFGEMKRRVDEKVRQSEDAAKGAPAEKQGGQGGA